MDEDLIIEEWPKVEETLRRQARHTCYITLLDRTHRDREEQIGRFDYEIEHALPWLEPDRGDDPVAEALHGEDDIDEDPLPDTFSLDEPPRPEPSPEQIAVAARRWVRDTVTRNMAGEGWRRFRLRCWARKASTPIDSVTFIARNTDPAVLDDPDPLPAPRLPARAPSMLDEEPLAGVSRAFGSLTVATTQVLTLTLDAMRQQQLIANGTIARLHQQNQSLHASTERLAGAVLNARVDALEAREEALAERPTDTRAEIAREGLKQLGSVANLLLVKQGVASDLLPVLEAAKASPELAAALHNPKVQALMRDPQTLRELAQIITAAAEETAESGAAAASDAA
ncbi:hypothetical protein L6R50_08895 [Myxococcota bacterium]|nr:hypothetical protein [Myxococcota bacterium]